MPDGRWSRSCGVSQNIVNSNKEQYVARVASQKNCQQHTVAVQSYGSIRMLLSMVVCLAPKLGLAVEDTEHTHLRTHTSAATEDTQARYSVARYIQQPQASSIQRHTASIQGSLAQLVPCLLNLLLQASLVSKHHSSTPDQAQDGTTDDAIDNATCMKAMAAIKHQEGQDRDAVQDCTPLQVRVLFA